MLIEFFFPRCLISKPWSILCTTDFLVKAVWRYWTEEYTQQLLWIMHPQILLIFVNNSPKSKRWIWHKIKPIVSEEADPDTWYFAGNNYRLTSTHWPPPPPPPLCAVPAVLWAHWTLFWVTWSRLGWQSQRRSICCGTVDAGQTGSQSHVIMCDEQQICGAVDGRVSWTARLYSFNCWHSRILEINTVCVGVSSSIWLVQILTLMDWV